MVKAFLGRVHDPDIVDYMVDQKIKVINDPAFRVVMMLNIKERQRLIREMGEKEADEPLSKLSRSEVILSRKIKVWLQKEQVMW